MVAMCGGAVSAGHVMDEKEIKRMNDFTLVISLDETSEVQSSEVCF